MNLNNFYKLKYTCFCHCLENLQDIYLHVLREDFLTPVSC